MQRRRRLGRLADSAAGGSASSEIAGADSPAKREGAGVVDAPAGAPDQAAKPADAAGASSVTAVAYDRKLARRADISITVADVDAAAVRVRAIAASAQGLVTAEAISSEPDVSGSGGFSTITISVPTADLDATLDQLAKLGKVHSRNASTDDVTAQYVDTEARVKTMQASVDRVRALMSQATKLGDVVALEAELSRRQADLEATQSQLAALKDSVALSPVEVRLSTDEQVLQQADDSTGFLAGLKSGWSRLHRLGDGTAHGAGGSAPVRRGRGPGARAAAGLVAAPHPAQPGGEPARGACAAGRLSAHGSPQSCSVTQSRRSWRNASGSSIDGRWAASGRSTRRTSGSPASRASAASCTMSRSCRPTTSSTGWVTSA